MPGNSLTASRPCCTSILFPYPCYYQYNSWSLCINHCVKYFSLGWQWFVAAAAPELVTNECDVTSNALWDKVNAACEFCTVTRLIFHPCVR